MSKPSSSDGMPSSFVMKRVLSPANSRSSPPVRSVIKFDGMCAYSAMYALFHSPLYAQDSGLSREHPINHTSRTKDTWWHP
jgi:hypothetical protein